MEKIYLTGKSANGRYAIVDDDFYEHAKKYSYSDCGFGYAIRTGGKDGKKFHIRMHTEVMGGKKEGLVIDHINGNKLDNRKENLRFCSEKENQRNKRVYKQNKIGYKGVKKRFNRFVATIGYNNKILYIGSFETAIQAAKRYNHFARQLHGEFARLNDI